MTDDERALSALLHELRTPLAAIAGYAELLTYRDDEEIRREAPTRIVEAAARMTQAVDRISEALHRLAETHPAAAHAIASPASRSGNPRRLLVVDDDEALRALLELTLRGDGYDLVTARDGIDALAHVVTAPPDLVLLDWEMPRPPGDTLLYELRRRHPELPLVVLTSQPAHREAAEALGATHFLAKPFSPVELVETVERLLDGDA